MATKPIPEVQQRLEACEAAVKDAQAALASADAARRAASEQLQAAHDRLHEARRARDAQLPQCDRVTTTWRTGARSVERVAIVNRTPKRVTVRSHGIEGSMTFALDARGAWAMFPRPRYSSGYSTNTITLENLPDPGKKDANP